MRLPVIGIAITLLCVIAFVFTWVLRDRSEDLAAFHEFKTYYSQHPYLELPELARRLPLGEIDPDVAPPPDEQRRVEQAELERLFERLVDDAGGAMRRYSLVPARGFLQLGWLTSFFLHFGWLHLLGNLLFLYITAPLLEDAWGRWRFLVFYLACGLIANLTQFALQPHANVSIAGASGAIAGCMGAFTVRFARQKVRMMYFIWLIRIWAGTAMVPAWICGVAWFARELLSLAGGGDAGVATGAHVGGFALGAGVALGMKALGFEKELLTAEEAELDTTHKSDLMETAAIAAARGELDAARESLRQLLEVVPNHEDAEALLGEVELRLGAGSAKFERVMRKLMAKRDWDGLVGTLVRVWPHVDASRLSSPFALQLAKTLVTLNRPKLEPMLEPLLRQAAVAGGRFETEARELMGSLKRQAIELDFDGAEPAGAGATAAPVQFTAVSREGLSVVGEGQLRVVAWSEILAVHAGVAPVAGRKVLLVDLVVQRAPPVALRLTSDDAKVAALFPGTPAGQAWRTFFTKLVNTARAPALPSGPEAPFSSFESEEAVTASWAGWASNGS